MDSASEFPRSYRQLVGRLRDEMTAILPQLRAEDDALGFVLRRDGLSARVDRLDDARVVVSWLYQGRLALRTIVALQGNHDDFVADLTGFFCGVPLQALRLGKPYLDRARPAGPRARADAAVPADAPAPHRLADELPRVLELGRRACPRGDGPGRGPRPDRRAGPARHPLAERCRRGRVWRRRREREPSGSSSCDAPASRALSNRLSSRARDALRRFVRSALAKASRLRPAVRLRARRACRPLRSLDAGEPRVARQIAR